MSGIDPLFLVLQYIISNCQIKVIAIYQLTLLSVCLYVKLASSSSKQH